MGIREFTFSKLYRFANRSLSNNQVMNQQDSGDRSPGFMMGWKPHQVLLGGKIRAQRSLAIFYGSANGSTGSLVDWWVIGGWLVSDQLITGILKSDQLKNTPSSCSEACWNLEEFWIRPQNLEAIEAKTPCYRTVPKSSRAFFKGPSREVLIFQKHVVALQFSARNLAASSHRRWRRCSHRRSWCHPIFSVHHLPKKYTGESWFSRG